MSERKVERLGLIGVGTMGSRMGTRLLDAGWDLVVHDIDPAVVEPLAARGATVAASPREVGDAVDVVLLSLPRPEHVEAVALGEDGIVAGARLHTCVDMSTTGPEVARAVSAALAEVGVRMLDAPVSGGPVGAESGTLCVMVGGPREAFDDCASIFAPIGTSIVWLGEQSGYGQTMKVINNMISASCLAATSEGMVLGAKAGLEPAAMIDVINSSTGRNAHSEQKFPNHILPRTFDFGFQIGLMLKDLRLCMEMAEELEVPMWVSGEVRQLVALAVGNAGGDQDITTLIKQVEAWSGVEVTSTDAAVVPEDH
ncbi:MAG: NAD(P)-dependent oxidoreductase [Solirubrobacterales bacterium]